MFRNKNHKDGKSIPSTPIVSTKPKSGVKRPTKRKRQISESETTETKTASNSGAEDSPSNSPELSETESENSVYGGEF